METNKNFDTQFSECLSVENSGIQTPPLSLVWNARNKVVARKVELQSKPTYIESILFFMQIHLKTYPLGITALLICSGFFYFNEPNYSYSVGSEKELNQNLLSIHNTTVSVSSSTLLTSIPTLIIRN